MSGGLITQFCAFFSGTTLPWPVSKLARHRLQYYFQVRRLQIFSSPMKISEFDPTRLIRTRRKAWRNLTKKAGLAGLRIHDLPHHAIPELTKSGSA
jgi:hypothetical protein